MQIGKNARYYLKRTRASSKEFEFNVPTELRARKDCNIDELFPLTIACIADFSVKIIEKKINEDNFKQYYHELYFSSKFYDSYININENNKMAPEDNNYFYLVGAIAYYLCDNIGSSLVLTKKINECELNYSSYKLDLLLFYILNNSASIDHIILTDKTGQKYIDYFIQKYNILVSEGIEVDDQYIANFRKYIYTNGSFRDVFLIDTLLAIFIIKHNNSIFKLLQEYSNIPIEKIITAVSKGCFVKELWTSQRTMCTKGMFKGTSGVVQMPTGAGKTKAVSLAIYSYLCTDNSNTSVIIAPFRALCREIYDDVKSCLSFDQTIIVNEVSDLLQMDNNEELTTFKKKNVVITTPEKFLYIIRQNNEIINSIGQIIFDEGHLFDDEERGANYELLISMILKNVNKETQKILISAIIPNVDEINRWFTNNEGIAVNNDSISSVEKLPAVLKWEKSIAQEYHCNLYFLNNDNLDEQDFFVPRIISASELSKSKREKNTKYFPDINPFTLKEGSNYNVDMAISCLLKLLPSDNAAIFCGRKDSVNKILSRILDLAKRNYNLKCLKFRSDDAEIRKISNLIELNYGVDNVVYQASKLGIFVHHSGISDGLKSSIEYAIKCKYINNVICTSTLAQGVNLPIKYLIVSSIYQAGEQIKVRDFQNLIGRTARSGIYTEGTIIFSDPSIYQNALYNWKWKKCKALLDPSKSERCSSTLLEIIRKRFEDESLDSFDIIKYYYEDQEKNNDIYVKYSTNKDVINWINYVINILGKIEGYLASVLNSKENYNELIDELLNATLAYSMAKDDEKRKLKTLFDLICTKLFEKFPDDNEKKFFSRSLMTADDYLRLKNKVNNLNVNELSNEDILSFVIEMMIQFNRGSKLKNFKKTTDLVNIAKLWMNGSSYISILKFAENNNVYVLQRKKYKVASLDSIISVCDKEFGYSSSIIINSICEIINNLHLSKDEKNCNSFNNIETYLLKIEQQLKYGLPNQTAIYVYELGFNDRYLSLLISDKIGNCSSKKETQKRILFQKNSIQSILNEFPMIFSKRLSNL